MFTRELTRHYTLYIWKRQNRCQFLNFNLFHRTKKMTNRNKTNKQANKQKQEQNKTEKNTRDWPIEIELQYFR